MNSRWILGHVGILLIGAGLAVGVQQKAAKDYDTAVEHFRQASDQDAQSAAEKMQAALTQIYQNIRTISFLPGVRKIDRHANNLDADSDQSIQQIYNNLVSNVAVSEVYIVPLDLNGDAIDPVTKQPDAPMKSYDTLIADPAAQPSETTTAAAAPNKPEQVEIHEYRLLHRQMMWLKEHYPTIRSFESLNTPVVSGEEVITCDNTDFDTTHSDDDRRGFVLSVPLYGPDGQIKGVIAAVTRTKAFAALLPGTDYALINPTYDYTIFAAGQGQQTASRRWIQQWKPDPALIYSRILPLSLNDPRAKWSLWVGLPNERFFQGSDASAVRTFKLAGFILCGLLAALGLGGLAILQRSFATTHANSRLLDQKVAARTAEIERLARRQEQERAAVEIERIAGLTAVAESVEAEAQSAVTVVAARTSAMTSNLMEVTGAVIRVNQSAEGVVAAVDRAKSNVEAVVTATADLSESILEIANRADAAKSITKAAVDDSERTQSTIASLSREVESIDEIARMITSIASRTNLLALNATIEAARAGAAGKGFAVVASEVKSLANQTAQSTLKITEQIGQIRAATSDAVQAVAGIARLIDRIEEVSRGIAQAIGRQTIAAKDITCNITLTRDFTREVASLIAEVSRQASAGERQATEVQADSARVAESIAGLQHALIRIVRSSAPETNRRASPRFELDQTCTITLCEQVASVRIKNISAGGISLQAVPGSTEGAAGTAKLSWFPTQLALTILRIQDDGTVVCEFDLAPDLAAAFTTALERYAASAALPLAA